MPPKKNKQAKRNQNNQQDTNPQESLNQKASDNNQVLSTMNTNEATNASTTQLASQQRLNPSPVVHESLVIKTITEDISKTSLAEKNETMLKDLESYGGRLLSFEDCEIQNLPKTIVAENGFYYDKASKCIKCISCSFTTNNLELRLFDLYEAHIDSKNMNCEYLQKQEENLPKEQRPEDNLQVKEYLDYDTRLKTFENIDMKLNKEELAKQGFYLNYAVEQTKPNFKEHQTNLLVIKCCYCGHKDTIFTKDIVNTMYESPFDYHITKSPYCEAVQIQNSSETFENIQIGFNALSEKIPINSENTIDTIQYYINANSNFDVLKNILNKSMNATCGRPFHPGYVTEQARLDSFREWPLNLAQQHIDMAKAGFYYYGVKDMVKCFYCNGGVRNWDPIDEPITEHARWFPKCPFIRQLKGASFIEEVREKYKNMDNGFKDDDDVTPQYYDVVNNDPPGRNSRKRSLSPRSINSRLDLPSIHKIIKLDFTRNQIKQVIENKLADDGVDFETLIDLVKALYKRKESSKEIQVFMEQFHLVISNVSNDKLNDISSILKKEFDLDVDRINIVTDSKNPENPEVLIFIKFKNNDPMKLKNVVAAWNKKKVPQLNTIRNIIAVDLINKDGDHEKEKVNNNQKIESNVVSKQDNAADGIHVINENTQLQIVNTTYSFGRSQDSSKLPKVSELQCNCVICNKRDLRKLFLPCYHTACTQCSANLEKCPVCQTENKI